MENKPRFLTILIVAAAITLAGVALAGGMGGGMGSGGGMGNGQGMGGGGHMMGNDSYMNSPNYRQPTAPRSFQRQDERETEKLRAEIQERKQELSDLFRQEPRNEQLIDKKIEELSHLQTELDRQAGDY
jgi:hypothetical protein